MSDYYIPDNSKDKIEISNKIPDSKVGKCIDDFHIQKIISKKGDNFVAKVKSKINNEIYVMKRIDKNKATHPIPNPQSPIPNPQSPIPMIL